MDSKNEELFLAIENNEIEFVKKLTSRRILGKTANVATVNEYGSTPLHVAAIHNRIEIGKILLDADAPVNAIDGDSRTPLHIASMHDHVNFIRILMIAKAKVNMKDLSNQTPLCYAVMNQCAASAELLLKGGGDPNDELLSQSNPGIRLLHYSIKNDSARLVNSLLRKGADVKLTDYSGKDALAYAKNTSQEVLNVLADYNLVQKPTPLQDNLIERFVTEYRRGNRNLKII